MTLQGTVTGQGSPTSYHFEYGLDTSYGQSQPVPDASAGAGLTAEPVTQQVLGLIPGTMYHFRLVAANAAGITDGDDVTFATPPGPPVVSTGPATPPGPPVVSTGPATAPGPPVVSTGAATAVTPNAAMLQGTVTGQGLPTSYHFEYGLDPSYGQSQPMPDASAGPGSTPVTQQVSGLMPGTTYHFRLVAANADGITDGDDVTFTTEPI